MRRTPLVLWFLIVVCCFSPQAFGYWISTYGTGHPPDPGDPGERILDIIGTTDGGSVATGSNIVGNSPTKYRFWIMKLDPYGNIQWQKYYSYGIGLSILQTADEGFLVAGVHLEKCSCGQMAGPLHVVKLDGAGSLQWQKYIEYFPVLMPHEAEQVPYSRIHMSLTSDEGYFITYGYHEVWSPNLPPDHWAVTKLSNTGTIEWSRGYGAPGIPHYMNTLTTTSDGGFLSLGKKGSDGWILKIGATGGVEWESVIAGDIVNINGVTQVYSGDGLPNGYVIGGMMNGGPSDSALTLPFLGRFDQTGGLIWQKSISGCESFLNGCNNGTLTELLGNGSDFLATLHFRAASSAGGDEGDNVLVKFNQSGEILWAKEYSRDRHDVPLALASTVSGDTLIGGLSFMANGLSAPLAMKVDADGNIPGYPLVELSSLTTGNRDAETFGAETGITNVGTRHETPPDYSAEGQAEKSTIFAVESNLRFHQQVDTPDPVGVGDTVTYTIELENMGPADATGVVVNGFITSGENLFVGWAGDLTVDGLAYTCNVGDLPVGGTETFSIVVTATERGVLESRATVASDLYDPLPDNNETFEETTVSPPGLSVDIADNPDPTCLGCGLSYTVTVTNFSTIDATGVVLTDTLPAGFDPSVYICSLGEAASLSGGVVTCDIGDLPAGGTATLTLGGTVTAAGAGTLFNTAEMTADGVDALPQHAATEETAVQYPDLSVTVDDWSDPVQAGYYLIYTVTASNKSTFPAAGVVVTDTLPPETELVSCAVSQGNWTESAGTVTVALGDLPGESSAKMTLVLKTLSDGIAVNAAEITNSLGTDHDPVDNIDSEETEITVWFKEDLGGFGGDDRPVSIDTDPAGNVWAAFTDGDGYLKLAENTEGNWRITTFGGFVTETALMVDDAGDVHVAYTKRTIDPKWGIKHWYLYYMHNTGGQWSQPALLNDNGCDDGPITSLEIVVKREPTKTAWVSCIGYLCADEDGPSYLWTFKSHPDVGFTESYRYGDWSAAMAVDDNASDSGQPHYSYFSDDILNDGSGYGGLGYFTRRDWDGIGAAVVAPGWGCNQCSGGYDYFTDIALDSQNTPHIVYTEQSDQELEGYSYATKVGDAWERTRLADGYMFHGGCAISLDDADGVHTVFYDVSESAGKVAYAAKTDDQWELKTIYVNPAGRLPSLYPDIVVDAGHTVHIAFLDHQNRLQVHSNRLALDTDLDAISDTEEMGPGGGDPAWDGNNDGTPDAQQPHVASLKTWMGTGYVTLAAPEGTILTDVKAVPNPSPLDAPAGADFPLGFFSFKILGIAPGASVAVTLILPENAQVRDYYKFGPTPGYGEDHWYAFDYDTVGGTGAVIDGNILTLHLVDGERGDGDIDANGVIVEPGGPSVTLPPDLAPGDVDGSGTVDVGDAVSLLQALAGRDLPEDVFTAADADGDGRLGLEEVIYILQSVSGQRE